MVTCRFCSAPAVARFALSEGCFCYPDDREQNLCLHHAIRANPIDEMRLVEDYTNGAMFTEWWEKGYPCLPF